MTAPTIPDGLEPIATWDVDTAWPGSWTEGHVDQANWWLVQHLKLLALDISRVEFYVFDGPFARVYPYTPRQPAVVPLGELPPAHLLRTT